VPPAYIENWQRGAEGERKTAKVLKPLQRSGLHVFHDIQTGHGNYDHVLVGPTGVFLLETKNLNGIVEMRDGTPHLLRRHDPDAETPIKRMRPSVLSAAARLKQEIERQAGLRPWVQAVVVLWADFPEGLAEHDRCAYVHGSRLRAWLRSRPNRISEDRAERIADAVAALADTPDSVADLAGR
jgi:Nuclease-related domain